MKKARDQEVVLGMVWGVKSPYPAVGKRGMLVKMMMHGTIEQKSMMGKRNKHQNQYKISLLHTLIIIHSSTLVVFVSLILVLLYCWLVWKLGLMLLLYDKGIELVNFTTTGWFTMTTFVFCYLQHLSKSTHFLYLVLWSH